MKNDKNNSEIKVRMIQYTDFKKIKKRIFFEKIGLSSSNFCGIGLYSDPNVSAVVNFLTNFSECSPYWLLLGKGEMLLSGGGAAPYTEAPETGAAGEANSLPVVADERQGYFASTPTEQVLRQLVSALERTIKDKEEIISLLKEQHHR